MVYPFKYWSWKCILNIYVITIILMTLGALKVMCLSTMEKESQRGDENETSNFLLNVTATTVAPSCGGLAFASINATAIKVPKLSKGETITCGWTIKSPHPSLIIGLAATQIVVNYYSSNNLDIDIYDGDTSSSPKVAHWHGVNDFNKILSPITTTGDTMFINYTATGDKEPMLELTLLYYICGGTIQNDMAIQSPVFNAKTSYEMPDFLQCFWLLETPDNSFYGYLHFQSKFELPSCDVLSLVALNGTLAVDMGAPGGEKTNLTTEGAILFTPDDLSRAKSPAQLKANGKNKTESRPNRIHICDSRVKAVAFSGRWAALSYSIQHPKPGHGFNVAFLQVRRMRPPKEKVPWYLNYAPVAIYLPIGVVIGMAIILIQGRQQGPKSNRRNRRSDEITEFDFSEQPNSPLNCENGSSKPDSCLKVQDEIHDVKQPSNKQKVDPKTCAFLTKNPKTKFKVKKVTFT